jgi:hypothetical protein
MVVFISLWQRGISPLPLSFDKIRMVSLVELFAKEGKNDSLDYVKSLNQL